ncbi:MAG TPA: glycosyltransferase family 2 protein [candidate division Zixibacteria bacterium]|nr:glycosyltransferase family 2 protein [candidate division Zixibacteria bacterium]
MTDNESTYKVAVVMPVFNEERYLARTLDQLYQQDFRMDQVEVVLADGGSTDRTREIAESYRERFGSMKILDNPGRLPSSGRNVGVKNSTAPYIIVLDGHCHIPSKTLLSDMVALFEQQQAACLCRPQPLDPPDIGEFEKAVAICRSSSLGHKPGSEIYADYEAEVDPTSSGAMYRREVFEQIGYFDERFDACEDVDFNFRVKLANLKSILSPKLKVFYYPRKTISGLWKQMMRYGRGRFLFAQKHNEFSLVQWLAGAGVALFVLLLLGALVSSRAAHWFRTLAGLYVLVVILYSAWLAHKEDHSGCLIYGPIIFPTVHFGLGVGFLRGLYEHLTGKDKKPRVRSGLDMNLI